MKITKSYFGTANTGEMIQIYHLENTSGAYVELIDYGCRLVRIVVPSQNQIMTDVCLGLETLEHYEKDTLKLGVVGGYGSQVWDARIRDNKLTFSIRLTNETTDDTADILLTVTFGWSEDNELSILYEAETNRETLFQINGYGYFNLNGDGNGDILSHELFVDADTVTVRDDNGALTGNLLPVEGTPFDFRNMHTIGKLVHTGHIQPKKSVTCNHNYIINGTGFREAVILQAPESGIRMTCFTDQPGLKLYVTDQSMESPGKDGKHYADFTSVCIETQHASNAESYQNFPHVVLRPHEIFYSKTLYHFSTF